MQAFAFPEMKKKLRLFFITLLSCLLKLSVSSRLRSSNPPMKRKTLKEYFHSLGAIYQHSPTCLAPCVRVRARVLQLPTVNIIVCEATHGAPHLFSWLSEVFLPVFLLQHQRGEKLIRITR